MLAWKALDHIIRKLAFSPCGQYVAANTERRVTLFSSGTGETIANCSSTTCRS